MRTLWFPACQRSPTRNHLVLGYYCWCHRVRARVQLQDRHGAAGGAAETAGGIRCISTPFSNDGTQRGKHVNALLELLGNPLIITTGELQVYNGGYLITEPDI
jgi:hypothetical protein